MRLTQEGVATMIMAMTTMADNVEAERLQAFLRIELQTSDHQQVFPQLLGRWAEATAASAEAERRQAYHQAARRTSAQRLALWRHLVAHLLRLSRYPKHPPQASRQT